MGSLCVQAQTEVVGKGNVMSIEDDIIRNLLNGFLVRAFHISPQETTHDTVTHFVQSIQS